MEIAVLPHTMYYVLDLPPWLLHRSAIDVETAWRRCEQRGKGTAGHVVQAVVLAYLMQATVATRVLTVRMSAYLSP